MEGGRKPVGGREKPKRMGIVVNKAKIDEDIKVTTIDIVNQGEIISENPAADM